MHRKELIDLGFSGSPFTWERDWKDWGLIEERLDRAMVNNIWMEHWSNTCVSHGPLLGSNHRPLIINTSPHFVSSPKPFKFEAYWLIDSDCASVISNAWNENCHGSFSSRWLFKLNCCRSALTKWSSSKFKNNRKEINKHLAALERINDIPDQAIQISNKKSIESQLGDLWRKEECYWLQRSRISWLKEGDSNTSFFHHSTIQRRQCNKVMKIKRDDDTWIENEGDIHNQFERHFISLFTSDGPKDSWEALSGIQKVVTAEMNSSISNPISMEEVKDACM
ncbi:hypothetical protein ACFX1T_034032 [Malus domestica]